jgi:hypothetical protein
MELLRFAAKRIGEDVNCIGIAPIRPDKELNGVARNGGPMEKKCVDMQWN